MLLYEKERPTSLDRVLGQDKAVKQVRNLLPAGGKAFWISGASGTGKTTLARIIADSIADEFFVTEYKSAGKLTMGELSEIERTMSQHGWGKGGRAYIVNESHGLRKDVIRELLGILEAIPDHVCFIFTTTKLGQESLFEEQIDASPLLSRCFQVTLTNQGLAKVFADHCRAIAQREGLDGKPLAAYVRLAGECHNNCREMLQCIQQKEMLA